MASVRLEDLGTAMTHNPMCHRSLFVSSYIHSVCSTLIVPFKCCGCWLSAVTFLQCPIAMLCRGPDTTAFPRPLSKSPTILPTCPRRIAHSASESFQKAFLYLSRVSSSRREFGEWFRSHKKKGRAHKIDSTFRSVNLSCPFRVIPLYFPLRRMWCTRKNLRSPPDVNCDPMESYHS
jgi:hypothetical protein